MSKHTHTKFNSVLGLLAAQAMILGTPKPVRDKSNREKGAPVDLPAARQLKKRRAKNKLARKSRRINRKKRK